MLATARSFACFMLLLVFVISTNGCGNSSQAPEASIRSGGSGALDDTDSGAGPVSLRADQVSSSSPAQSQIDYHPEVIIRTTMGDITVRLDAKNSPRTVEHFLENHVDIQFYDGTVFHYIQDDSMVIAGGYNADLSPVDSRGAVLNEADNGLSNKRGTIALARHPEARNSATCQFFFNLKDNSQFDHQDDSDDAKFGYCVFGEVISGMDVLVRIGKVDVHDTDDFPSTPVEPVAIRSVRRIK